MKQIFTLLTLALVLSNCTHTQKEDSLTEGGMKCGPGKCGASMVDGSAALVKKKMNILKQLREKDTRRDCVLKANSTKALYDCVRVTQTNRLSTKCESGKTNYIPEKISSEMKCAPGKCGSNM